MEESMFTPSQQLFMVLCPKFTSIPSLLGSLYIMQHVLRSPKRRHRLYTRIMLGMSCMDFIWAIKAFLSSWVVPASYELIHFPFAVGTVQTCTAAGFLGHGATLASVLYNGSLALYYLLTIRYGWTQRRFDGTSTDLRTRSGGGGSGKTCCCCKWEWFLHGVPLGLGWGTALIALPLHIFNPIGWTCFLGPWPPTCDVTDGIPCTRGANAKFYRFTLFQAPFLATLIFLIVAMASIYCKIRGTEQATKKYSAKFHQSSRDFPSNDNLGASSQFCASQASDPSAAAAAALPQGRSARWNSATASLRRSIWSLKGQQQQQQQQKDKKESLSKRFASQSFYYVFAFGLSWIFTFVQIFVMYNGKHTNGVAQIPFALSVLSSLTNPMQGFFNALVYIRPRYLRFREQQEKKREEKRQQRQRAGKDRQQRRRFRLGDSSIPSAVSSIIITEEDHEEGNDMDNVKRRGDDDGGDDDVGKQVENESERPRDDRLLSTNTPTESDGVDNDHWQALVNAFRVSGEDDEDDWEAQEDEEEQQEEQDVIVKIPEEIIEVIPEDGGARACPDNSQQPEEEKREIAKVSEDGLQ